MVHARQALFVALVVIGATYGALSIRAHRFLVPVRAVGVYDACPADYEKAARLLARLEPGSRTEVTDHDPRSGVPIIQVKLAGGATGWVCDFFDVLIEPPFRDLPAPPPQGP
jgi:hypothetical protein